MPISPKSLGGTELTTTTESTSIAGPGRADPPDTAGRDSDPGTLPAAWIPIREIAFADSPRLAGRSEEHAELLAQSQTPLPPILVHRASMRVIDGAHRLRAAVLRGQEQIQVRFVDGSEAESFVLAVRANIEHGLPLTRADRSAAAGRIIRLYPHWSDRRIAGVVGLSPKTVGSIRARSGAEIPSAPMRVGRDGRLRPVNSDAGRTRAGELLLARPEMRLGDVAAEAGVSVSTVRAVRELIRRGEHPGPRHQADAGRPPADRGRPVQPRGRLGPRRARPDEVSAGILLALSRDPAIRLNEQGRVLLRLLAANALDSRQLAELAQSVPRHCAELVASVARQFADNWQQIARLVEEQP